MAEDTDHSIDLASFAPDQKGMDLSSVNAYYNLAQRAFNEKRYRLAVIYLRKILQIDNSFVSAFKMLAKIFQIRKNYNKAADILRQAVDSNFKDAELHYQLGYIYYLQGNLPLFARECTKALVVNPNFAKAYYALALLNYELLKFDKAEEELRKCLKLNEHDADAHFLLAKIHIRCRRFPQARQELLTCIKLSGTKEEAYIFLAGITRRLGDIGAAIEYYRLSGRDDRKTRRRIVEAFDILKAELEHKIVEQPTNTENLMDLASLYFNLEKYTEAKNVLSKVLQINPKDLTAKVNYGLMLIYEHDFLNGVRLYQEVLAVSPAHREAQSNLAKAYQLAEEYYRANFRQDGNKKALLEIYMQQEQYDKAVLVMRSLRSETYAREILDRLSRRSLPSYKIYQAAVLVLLNEMDQARYVLEHIESENKTNPAVYYFLGILSKKQGRLTESYRFFEKSKMLDNNYWFADHELKAIREAEIERLEQSLDQDGSAEKYLEYADLLRMTGQYKKALTVLIECKDAGYTNAEFSDSMKKTIDLYEQDLERDLEGDTPTRQTFMDLGEIYVHKKRFTEAFTIFQTAVSLYPKDKELSSFYGFLIKKNIEVYEGMLKTQESTMVYYNLAVMYALSDRKQEMFTALDKAIRRDKKLAMQARYEDAFKPFRDQDRFRLVTLIEGEDKNIYRMQD